jgi:hypothetical protein
MERKTPPPEGAAAYFSSSDGGMDDSLEEWQFSASLVYNLLFEERGLLIPDIFFFNNQFVLEHLVRHRYPLFLRALEHGLIIPAFREEGTEDFTAALEAVGGQKILGADPALYRRIGSDPREIAAELDAVWRVRSRGEPRIWPPNMGQGFEKEIVRTLQQDRLSFPDEADSHRWDESSRFRGHVLEEAKRASVVIGGESAGIRRAEIWNAAGRILGMLDEGESFDKPHQLRTGVVPATRNAHKIRQVELLIDVVNMAYQRSQARQFEVLHNIPSAYSDVSTAVYGEADKVKPQSSRLFDHLVRVPSVDALLRADTGALLQVRDRDEGRDYFRARRAWLRGDRFGLDIQRLDERLRDAADAYARALRTLAPAEEQSTPTRLALGGIGAFGLLGAMATLEYEVNTQAVGANFLLASELGLGLGALLATFRPPRGVRLERIQLKIESEETTPQVTPDIERNLDTEEEVATVGGPVDRQGSGPMPSPEGVICEGG